MADRVGPIPVGWFWWVGTGWCLVLVCPRLKVAVLGHFFSVSVVRGNNMVRTADYYEGNALSYPALPLISLLRGDDSHKASLDESGSYSTADSYKFLQRCITLIISGF